MNCCGIKEKNAKTARFFFLFFYKRSNSVEDSDVVKTLLRNGNGRFVHIASLTRLIAFKTFVLGIAYGNT